MMSEKTKSTPMVQKKRGGILKLCLNTKCKDITIRGMWGEESKETIVLLVIRRGLVLEHMSIGIPSFLPHYLLVCCAVIEALHGALHNQLSGSEL